MNDLIPISRQDGGIRIGNTGYWILDTGYWILDTGYWILDYKYISNNPYILTVVIPVPLAGGIHNKSISLDNSFLAKTLRILKL